MKVSLLPAASDSHVDGSQNLSQRQLGIAIAAIAEASDRPLPLNLCLVLDHSGSMSGKPLETVKQAALRLVENLTPNDRLSLVAFDHRAKVILPNQAVTDLEQVKRAIKNLQAEGGTCIDEGMKLGIEQAAEGKQDRISQIFLLTDGENEHGDNERCLKLAELAAKYNISASALGFGVHWNQDVLEKIADSAAGSLSYIEYPEQAASEFSRLFARLQSVGLTNAYLLIELMPQVRLAQLKPAAQVAPETVELTVVGEENPYAVRLGDLMTGQPREVLLNLYLGQLPPGKQVIAALQVRYDDPALSQAGLLSEKIFFEVEVQSDYQPNPNPQVQQSILALAKYRQTQIAETKLQQGDRTGAATMLQAAAQTAIQLGDRSGATVLQASATRLQGGEDLSEGERKKTRMAAKTVLQSE